MRMLATAVWWFTMVSVHCLLWACSNVEMVKRKIAIVTASHNLQQRARQVGEPPTLTATPEENGCQVNMAYER